MLVRTARYNLFFPKVSNLRRKAFEIEETLSPYFTSVTLIPIPDDAPEEIPRIATSSHNGHSTLNISLTNAQISTSYDEKFERDWESCLSYLKERVFQISNVLSSYIEGDFLFSGLTTEIVFDDLGENTPLELIKTRFLNYKGAQEPYDLEYKMTFVVDDSYYVNITFSNMRIYEGIHQAGAGIMQFSELQETANLLGVVVDINNRFAFNHKKDHHSSQDSIEKIFEITYGLLDSRLKKMIEEGEVEI